MHTYSRHLVGGHKSELVWDLYIVQQPSRFHCQNTGNKKTTPKATEQTNQNQTKNKHQKRKGESDRRSSSVTSSCFLGRDRKEERHLSGCAWWNAWHRDQSADQSDQLKSPDAGDVSSAAGDALMLLCADGRCGPCAAGGPQKETSYGWTR